MLRTTAVVAFVIGCGYNTPPPSIDAAPALPQLGFEVASSGADEHSGTVLIEVVLSTASTAEVTVNYAVTGGTATPGSDFTVGASSLTFAPGDLRKEIPVTIVSDTDESESTETIQLTLSNPAGATLAAQSTHTVSISDHILPRVQFMAVTTSTDEATPTMLTVTLDKPAEGASTIVVGVAGGSTPDFPATPGTDATITDGTPISIADGATSASIPIGEVDDPNDEETETLVFALRSPSTNLAIGSLSSSTHRILDNDNPPVIQFAQAQSMAGEAAGTTTIDVSLSVASGKTVTVDVAFAGSTATATANDLSAGTSLTFAPGEVTKQITVTITNDTTDEDDEVFTFSLANPVNATLGTQTTHALTIQDDDGPPSVQFTAATSTKDDDDPNLAVTVTVALSAASERTITVPWAVDPASTANDPADYSVTVAPLVFAVGGSLTRTITIDVAGNNNGSPEPDETVILDLQTPTNATLGPTATHTLTITD